jgi:nucleoid DNA-binding protein
MSTWQNFGKWYGELSKGASNLSAERTAFLQELVKGAANDREKTRIIYNYLQANCRYVLIVLGIGGFKPFDADFVDKKKYGDCKALSNYMQACLRAVGVTSYQALINASYNKEPVDPLFPHNGFNHVIVCVPLKQDTVWLECTNNLVEFGKLGNFTENRNALLITEEGGKLVPTPTSKATENQFSASTIINLDADGSGLIQVALNTSGEFKFELVNYLTNQNKDELKHLLVNIMGFIQPDDFEINYDRAAKASSATIRLAMEKVPQFTAGKKLFLNPRMYKIWNDALPSAENRKLDYYFEHPFVKTDSTIYALPEGFEIETLPKSKKLSFEFGSFESHYTFDRESRHVISYARLELQQYKIPAAKFMAAKKFFEEVLNEYTEKIVVKRP